jgi:2-hydroxy-3-oxopropionate reductase
MTDIAYIGPGIMGRPMALNLIAGGHNVFVYARRPEAAEPLVKAGATACDSPAEAARHAEIIFSCVSDTPDVEEVLLGQDGVIHGAKPGSVVVDMSTISPSATRTFATQLATRDIHMLDAPVSGGEQGAIAGTLSIMVGGDAADLARVRPLLDLLGKNIVHVGDHGAGQTAKACNQIVVAQTIVGVAEALQLAKNAGVDPARVREALLGGFAYSRILDVHGQRMLEENFKPGFKAKLHAKDLRIALEEGRAQGLSMESSAAAADYIFRVAEELDGELDHSAVIKLMQDVGD